MENGGGKGQLALSCSNSGSADIDILIIRGTCARIQETDDKREEDSKGEEYIRRNY